MNASFRLGPSNGHGGLLCRATVTALQQHPRARGRWIDGNGPGGTIQCVENNQYQRKRRPPILLDGVTLTYPGAHSPTLTNVNLHVGAGEFVSVVGSSGAGKTTLLRLLTGALTPTSGRAIVAGLDLADLPARKLPALRRQIGVTFQDARLLPGRTALQNIAYALELTGARSRTAAARASEVLEEVGIAHLASRLPQEMSGGEAQRVGIARALAGRPQVLLADEPTGNLDPETTVIVVDTLSRLADAGTAVLMVTHDVAAIDHLARRVIRLTDGAIAADRTGARYADTTSIPVVSQNPPTRGDREGRHS